MPGEEIRATLSKPSYHQRNLTKLDYIGCFVDAPIRDLNGENFSSSDMTPGTCLSFCTANGFEYAGISNYVPCNSQVFNTDRIVSVETHTESMEK